MSRPRRILASSGGFVPTGRWGVLAPGGIMLRALELSGAIRPRVCLVLTACGDDSSTPTTDSGTSDGRLPWVPSDAGNDAFLRAMQVAALQSELPADMPPMKRRIAMKQAERTPHGPTCLSDFVARVLAPTMIRGETVIR